MYRSTTEYSGRRHADRAAQVRGGAAIWPFGPALMWVSLVHDGRNAADNHLHAGAVECLTLWLERDRASAALHIAQLRQDPEEADELIVGLLNLRACASRGEVEQGRHEP
jgi:hypothetical protein